MPVKHSKKQMLDKSQESLIPRSPIRGETMRTVTAEITLNANPSVVLRAFVDIDAMKKWWSVDRGLVEARSGGVWALCWERSAAGFRYVTAGVIRSYHPAERLEIEKIVYCNPDHIIFGPMEIDVNVKADANGTHLTLRQDGYQKGAEWDWYYQAVLNAWPEALKMLKKYCEP
jgi:uncharacterized protein YndB with AHSA1/START domain